MLVVKSGSRRGFPRGISARISVFCGIVVATLASAAAQAGPLDKLYLTNGDGGTSFIVQGSSVTPYTQKGYGDGSGNEYAIAVSGGTVRQLGNGNQGAGGFIPGAQYDYAGNWTGITYGYPGGAGFYYYDGTSDGSHNYAANYGSGGVYKFDLDWTNQSFLFATPELGNPIGITYDSGTNSFWVANFLSTTLYHYDSTGNLLGSFVTAGGIAFAAYDPGDGTLWIGGRGQGNLYQYDTSGNLLSSPFYADLENQNILGGEFAIDGTPPPVPEPATLVSAAMAAALGLVVARRRARSA